MDIDPAQKVRTRLVATLMVVTVVVLETAALMWIDRTSLPVVSHVPVATSGPVQAQ